MKRRMSRTGRIINDMVLIVDELGTKIMITAGTEVEEWIEYVEKSTGETVAYMVDFTGTEWLGDVPAGNIAWDIENGEETN